MEAKELRALVNQAYAEPAWHGPNLRSAVRGVTVREALWRPGPNRPCIWELVLHCAYWKHQVTARVTGRRERFPRRGRNFPSLPERRDEAAWRADLKLLDGVHARLVQALETMTPAELNAKPAGERFARKVNITGILMHDTYHAGQIRLLRKLQETRRGGRK